MKHGLHHLIFGEQAINLKMLLLEDEHFDISQVDLTIYLKVD